MNRRDILATLGARYTAYCNHAGTGQGDTQPNVRFAKIVRPVRAESRR